MTKLIFGCGYLGMRVAERWRALGERVVVVTRSPQRAKELRLSGFEPIVGHITHAETLSDLPAAETVLFAVGFDRTAGQSMEMVFADGLRNVLVALPQASSRLIYVSTTGVYGNAAGDWIDEDTPPDPQREGGRASLAAERALTAHPLGRNAVILRLAGIYGPGRIPFRSLMRGGKPIPTESQGWLNLIHVADAASVVLAAEDVDLAGTAELPRIYCVSDGHPVQRRDYYGEVARRIGAVSPTFISPPPDSPRAERTSSDRRITNARMLAELRVKLVFPDYRSGLAAILG
jgi:nucleoside-diphosphate-sugar epimerase